MSFNVFDISASGMYAQRTKMDVIASNVANINTTRNPDGTKGVYKKKEVSFQAVYAGKTSEPQIAFPNGKYSPYYSQTQENVFLRGGISYESGNISTGVEVAQISESKDPYKIVYDPSNPDSDVDGYVKLPNINIVEEMVNMVSASKAYEANAAAVDAAKSMINSALRI